MRAELQRLRNANPISLDGARAWLETEEAAIARSKALGSDAPLDTGHMGPGRRRWLVALAAGAAVLVVALPAFLGSAPTVTGPSIDVSTTATSAEGDPFHTEVVQCVAARTGNEHPAVRTNSDGMVSPEGQSVLDQAATEHPDDYQDCFDDVLGLNGFGLFDADPRPDSAIAIGLIDPDWLVTEDDLTPAVTDPQERFSISNYPLDVGGDRCAQVPVAALDALGPNDFLLQVLQRAGSASGFPPRPPTFAGRIQGIDDGDHWECVAEEERSDIGTLRWIDFELEGQGFYVLAVLGVDFRPFNLHQVERSLDSLRVGSSTRSPSIDEILADDIVTETEMSLAGAAVVACMEASGVAGSFDLAQVGFVVPEGGEEAFGTCHQLHMGRVDQRWTQQQAPLPEEELAFYQSVLECTEAATDKKWGDLTLDEHGFNSSSNQRLLDEVLDEEPFAYMQCFQQIVTRD